MFGLLVVLYAVFILLAHSYFTPVLPLLSWALFGKLLLVLAPLLVLYAWRQRSQLIALDYRMLWLPLLVWVVTSYVFKSVSWWLFQGRAAFGPYGADKGLANAMVELEIVALVTGLQLLRIPLTSGRPASLKQTIAARLRLAILGCAVLVALVVPPLPD